MPGLLHGLCWEQAGQPHILIMQTLSLIFHPGGINIS